MSSIRAAMILTRDDKVALIRRRRANAEYYLFPGGGVEAYETAIECARREAKEELGLDIEVGRHVATVYFGLRTQVFFAGVEIGGSFGTGSGDELAWGATSPYGTYEPVWVAFADLARIDVRPRALAALLAADGLPLRPVEIVEPVTSR
jgi:8-oxo-dGTP pyrophosphatase MutT (NUDIX family)